MAGNPKATCPKCGRENIEGEYGGSGTFSGVAPGSPPPKKSEPLWRFDCPQCGHKWEDLQRNL
jgi:predicted nucleic-acid-binding Zn-ribbon protein